jgi:hypothetical protein
LATRLPDFPLQLRDRAFQSDARLSESTFCDFSRKTIST